MEGSGVAWVRMGRALGPGCADEGSWVLWHLKILRGLLLEDIPRQCEIPKWMNRLWASRWSSADLVARRGRTHLANATLWTPGEDGP